MKSLIRHSIIRVFIATVLGLLITTSVMAAVRLLYFRAGAGDQVVNLSWDSADETDTLGYTIERSETGIESDYVRISVTYQLTMTDIIIVRGSDEDPNNDYSPYNVEDHNVVNGTKYWYRLKEYDQNSGFIDPQDNIVTIIPGLPTAISTTPSTNTPTVSPTRTPTKTSNASGNSSNSNKSSKSPSPTATKQPTVFRQPTNTPAVQPPASTPVPGVDVQPVEANPTELSATDTPTLDAAPRLTLVLGNSPAQEEQVTLTPVATSEPTAKSSGWISKKGITIIGVLAAVWLALGGWFFLSFRRME